MMAFQPQRWLGALFARIVRWALVSEPGFWDFQIFRFLIFDICSFRNMFLGNLVVRYRGKIIKAFWIDPGQNGWGHF